MPTLREFTAISSRPPRKLACPGGKFVLLLLSAALCSAATIYDSGVVALAASSPLQTGRLNRNGLVSDWSAPKDFPGAVNPTISYHYETFVLAPILYPYIQISVDDVSGAAQTFASAYLNSYTPGNTAPNNGLDINYLGDTGNSGNLFGGNPRAFQVLVPLGNTLVLVVNDASPTGGGLGLPFRIIAEGFSDTNFNDAPEPATFGFVAAVFGAGALLVWKRKQVQ
jgi:hypothetical protein